MNGFAYNQSVELSATDQTVYQQDVVIHRTAGIPYEELVGGLYVLHFYVGDKCNADYGDVRFTDTSGNALAYYLWSDYDAESARFCVRLSVADSAGALHVWYGNSAATTTSDGDATYLFFDDFLGSTLNATKWVSSSGVSVSDGICSITGSSNWNARGISTQQTFGNNVTLEIRNRMPTGANEVMYGFANHLTYTSGMSLHNNKNNTLLWVGTSGTMIGTGLRGSYGTNYIIRTPSAFKVRDSAGNTGSTTALSGDFPVSINVYEPTQQFDYVLVRAYSANPPSATAFSGEQDVGGSKASAGVTLGSANMMVI